MQPMINEFQFKIFIEEVAERFYDLKYDTIHATDNAVLPLADKVELLVKTMAEKVPATAPHVRTSS